MRVVHDGFEAFSVGTNPSSCLCCALSQNVVRSIWRWHVLLRTSSSVQIMRCAALGPKLSCQVVVAGKESSIMDSSDRFGTIAPVKFILRMLRLVMGENQKSVCVVSRTEADQCV